jgi:hypothetical protein
MTEAQARRRWTPPAGTLGELLAGARERVHALAHDEGRL